MKELRFQNVISLYYKSIDEDIPRQLDLLSTWFLDWIVKDKGESEEKIIATYDDYHTCIKAYRYHDRLYLGDTGRIPQILGRLIGNAKGNAEKERKTAELIQKHISRLCLKDPSELERFLKHVENQVNSINEIQKESLWQSFFDETIELAIQRNELDDYEKDNEAYPMQDEVFDAVVYNVIFQLVENEEEGLYKAFAWLLLGSLLRNEVSRIAHIYDSYFHPIYRAQSEDDSLLSKLEYLLFPEDYIYEYSGEDTGEKYPDVFWYCDSCNALLNQQEGFDDHQKEFQCQKCGHLNKLDYQEIYESKERYGGRLKPVSKEAFLQAIKKKK